MFRLSSHYTQLAKQDKVLVEIPQFCFPDIEHLRSVKKRYGIVVCVIRYMVYISGGGVAIATYILTNQRWYIALTEVTSQRVL